MSGQHWLVNSDHALELFLAFAAKLYADKRYIDFQWKTGQQRTLSQNAAIHTFCRLLASELNERGLDMRSAILPAHIDIPWTQDAVKEHLWRGVQKKLLVKNQPLILSAMKLIKCMAY